MNRSQWIALAIALANLALILLFPPFDYLSLQRGNVPTFSGFHFALAAQPNRVLNQNFLSLEVFVVLINAAIAWLLLRPAAAGKKQDTGLSRGQRGILALVAVNLVLCLLFPPFENYMAISKAALPTFEGFYFVFGDNNQRQLVTPLLYLEVSLILINGGLLWLLFKKKGQEQLTPEQMRALARKFQAEQTKH
ncbi:MAG TPA: hypothetical protein VL968_09635 [Rhodocyclaceae bacterium]|jgi:hypothetical protein|nr:hypothetical protein [Rhodocyclaceae bacterium]